MSIGLHVRNGSDRIHESLNFLLGQTYKNFELIISDNASTDNTQEICERYARRDSRIRYVRQKVNIGGYGNFDFVRKAARGEYFMLATDDDTWDRKFIEKCLEKFGEIPDAVAVCVNVAAFKNEIGGEGMIYRSPLSYFSFSPSLYQRLKEYVLTRTNVDFISVMFYGLWKTKVINSVSLTDDFNFAFKLLFAGRIAHINEFLFFKRYGNRVAREEPLSMKIIKSILHVCTDRLHVVFSSFFSVQSSCIIRSRDLTSGEKIRLVLYELYSYLRAIGDGHR